MKKICKGFTLSELLIVLTLIGVIAIVTIPSLIKNVNKQQIGPMLARSIEQIEVGCQNMMQAANNNRSDGSYGNLLSSFTTRDLDPSSRTDSSLCYEPFRYGAVFMGLEHYSDHSIVKLKTFDGKVLNLSPLLTPMGSGAGSSSADVYKFTKSPATVYLSSKRLVALKTNKPEEIIVDIVIIDINGLSKPNTLGKDMFMFKLQNDGKLVPYGLPNSGDSYLDNCTDNNITDGKACAARVIADGFKVTYNIDK